MSNNTNIIRQIKDWLLYVRVSSTNYSSDFVPTTYMSCLILSFFEYMSCLTLFH